MSEKIKVINDGGYEVEIEVDNTKEYPTESGSEVYCLTCGTLDENALEVKTVGHMDGMKTWLEERFHNLSLKDQFLLCGRCEDEFYYGE